MKRETIGSTTIDDVQYSAQCNASLAGLDGLASRHYRPVVPRACVPVILGRRHPARTSRARPRPVRRARTVAVRRPLLMPIARTLTIVVGRRPSGRYLSATTKPDVTDRTLRAGMWTFPRRTFLPRIFPPEYTTTYTPEKHAKLLMILI